MQPGDDNAWQTATTSPDSLPFSALKTCAPAGKSFHLSEFGVNSPGAKPSDIDLHTYPGNNVSGSVAGDYSVYLTQPHFNFGLGGLRAGLGLERYGAPDLPVGNHAIPTTIFPLPASGLP